MKTEPDAHIRMGPTLGEVITLGKKRIKAASVGEFVSQSLAHWWLACQLLQPSWKTVSGSLATVV